MAQFLWEIGTEEMPARFLPDLMQQLADLFVDALQELGVGFDGVETYGTPRRLVVWVADIETRQREREEFITGPPVRIAYDDQGELTRAGSGFAASQGIASQELFTTSTEKGDYLAARVRRGGEETIRLLPGICSDILGKLSFPKKMRWESSGFLFGRPIRWMAALLDQEVVPVQGASLAADRFTWGHRVQGPGPFRIPGAGEYFRIIREQGAVVLDRSERKERVKREGEELAREKGGSVVWEEDLLQEVIDVVEFPKAVLGSLDRKYLDLPRNVLLTCMESHQKCFGVEDGEGNLLPHFLCTLNLEPKDLDLVRSGWERVLKARLEDANFFWGVDSRASLEQWREELKKVVFMGPLGSMWDKSERLRRMGRYLDASLNTGMSREIERAAAICKTDLVSEVVGEFDNLQGHMGGIYARQKGEPETVARAVEEHYQPEGPESPVPESMAGALLSVADKLDNLVGCFSLNMVPTGAQDPYALRRQALGIVRIILEKGLRLSLSDLIRQARESYDSFEDKLSPEECRSALEDFFLQRVRGYYTGQGYGTLVVEAAIQAGADDLCLLDKRLKALDRFSRETDFEPAVLTFKRVDNIIRKQGAQEGPLDGEYDAGSLSEAQEKELARSIEELGPKWRDLWQQEDFDSLLAQLRELRPVVDAFFDHVMVMTQDSGLRRNRLNLLWALLSMLSGLAAFSELQI
ncbi:MAG: glycine--tRNA ligase subunit beta [Desulfohalobiaceae bacterium]|nr:glycine--tRNA ligase subunit beta [Desulfohalobiaceae bacterium]